MQNELNFDNERSFYDTILNTVTQRATLLDRDRVYGWIDVLGEDLVYGFDEIRALFAEVSLEHLVENRRVPLIAIKRKPGDIDEYILK